LASPGTPSSRQWPPASRPTSRCSTVSAWPTITLPISARSAASRDSSRSTSASASGSSAAAPIPRSRSVVVIASSRRQRVHHHVDGELGVVLRQPALVAPVVVPLAAVVLVAVEDGDAAVDLDRLEVVVHQVVAPAVELEGGRRRAVVEVEEGVVDPVRLGDLAQRVFTEDFGHL